MPSGQVSGHLENPSPIHKRDQEDRSSTVDNRSSDSVALSGRWVKLRRWRERSQLEFVAFLAGPLTSIPGPTEKLSP